MGYIEKVNDTEHQRGSELRLPYIYNVTQSVGRRGVNRHLDVKMVQHLLNIIKYTLGMGSEDLKPDGICGHKTEERILRFQQMMKARTPAEFKADGRFDSVPNHSFFTPSHKRRYSIVYLNAQARIQDPFRFTRLWQLVPFDRSEYLDDMTEFYQFQAAPRLGLRIPQDFLDSCE